MKLFKVRQRQTMVFPGRSVVENLPVNVGDTWVEKLPWKSKWQPTPVFLPRKSHGQRMQATVRRVKKVSDMT